MSCSLFPISRDSCIAERGSLLRSVLTFLLMSSMATCFHGHSTYASDANRRSEEKVLAIAPRRLAARNLMNLVQVHPTVLSGGVPDGAPGFQELADLGIKTLLSVDAATPDVAGAARFGLTYVHLPHGYDGIPSRRVTELAKAVRDLEGPIYIHCHHGKHRSPAAASVACVAAGLISPADALSVLALAGTSRQYRGLHRSVRDARQLDQALLDELNIEFQEAAEVAPIAEAMAALERTHDNLGKIAQAGWRAPPSHPDLDPVHEALLLQEHFAELLRRGEVQQQPEQYRQLLHDSETNARRLRGGLSRWRAQGNEGDPPECFARLASGISRDCRACHRKFRD